MVEATGETESGISRRPRLAWSLGVIFNHIKILSQDEIGGKRKRKGEKEEVARMGVCVGCIQLFKKVRGLL